MRLEDTAMFMRNSSIFIDNEGNPLDMDYFQEHFNEIRPREEKLRFQQEEFKKLPLRDQLIHPLNKEKHEKIFGITA